VGAYWGNWQYLAGVGADARGHRKFDLRKQTQLYDPQQVFIRKWEGNSVPMNLHALNVVDWSHDNG
jgi:deoxyribodipyrimidine photo-lyase